MNTLSFVFLSFIFSFTCFAEKPKIKEVTAFDKVCMAEKNNQLRGGWDSVKKTWKAVNEHYNKATNKRRKLVVFMDGTGNDKSSNTNIWKLYKLSVRHACSGDNPVIPYYDKGVGAKAYNKILGGGIGWETGKNIQQAYRFLAKTYEDADDEIYIFGFSRGAFTARSLNGMLEYVGLVKRKWLKTNPINRLPFFDSNVENLYKAYNIHHDGRPTFLDFTLRKSILKAKKKLSSEEITTKNVDVLAIGVFDTVAALGASLDDKPDNHRMDLYADNGFHALSLDEQRKAFRLSRFNPIKLKKAQHLEEVWFPGVHSNVGGGYNKLDGLSKLSLDWMISRFIKYNIFPDMSKHSCKEERKSCGSGELKDAFFDEKIWSKLEIYQRWPMKDDFIHESVFLRKDIVKENLIAPHKDREPKGYEPMNIKGKEYYQIVNNSSQTGN